MRRNFIQLILIVACFTSASTPADGQPPPSPPPTATSSQQPKSNSEPPFREGPISYADFSNFNLSTPKKAVVTFVQLFNGIVPASPSTDFQEICQRTFSKSSYNSCITLLENRSRYLKSIARNLKGARFKYQSLTQASEKPTTVTTSWREILFFFDGTMKEINQDMTISLEQSDKDWKVIQLE